VHRTIYTILNMAHSFTFTMVGRFQDFNTNKERADAYIRNVLEKLDFGVFYLDIVPVRKMGQEGRLKVFVHYTTSSPAGELFHARLAEKEVQQREAEEGEVFNPLKIFYNQDRYWKIYKSMTPEERAAAKAAKDAAAAAFHPQIV
jgi:hypothetical protein